MDILKINNGKVELLKDSGSLIMTIGKVDGVNAGINNDDSLIFVTTVKGKVQLCKDSGYGQVNKNKNQRWAAKANGLNTQNDKK